MSDELEREKLQLEYRKLDIELRKARWMAISIAVPLVAALGTISLGVWNSYEQAKLNFQSKVADIVQNTLSQGDAYNRIEFLSNIVGYKLPEEIVKKGQAGAYNRDVGPKRYFIDALTKTGLSPAQLIRVYRAIFPGDAWAEAKELDQLPGPDPVLPNANTLK